MLRLFAIFSRMLRLSRMLRMQSVFAQFDVYGILRSRGIVLYDDVLIRNVLSTVAHHDNLHDSKDIVRVIFSHTTVNTASVAFKKNIRVYDDVRSRPASLSGPCCPLYV